MCRVLATYVNGLFNTGASARPLGISFLSSLHCFLPEPVVSSWPVLRLKHTEEMLELGSQDLFISETLRKTPERGFHVLTL